MMPAGYLMVTFAGDCSPANVQTPVPQASPPVKAIDTVAQLPSLATAIEKAIPSMVFIYTEKKRLAGGKPVFEGGSGVVLKPDGYIFTNHHVVKDAKKVWVTLYDRSTYEAVSIFPDQLTNLAVVKNKRGRPAGGRCG